MKKEYKKVFIDTAPVIYLLDNDPRYVDTVKRCLLDIIENKGEIVISTVTVMEYLVVPYRENRWDRVAAFYSFINEMRLRVCNIDMQTAERSAQIRAEHSAFRSLDSIQLACAVTNGCSSFLTNDRQLRQYKGIRVECVSDTPE